MTFDPALHAALRPESRLLLLSAGGPELEPAIRALASVPMNWLRLSRTAESELASDALWRRIAPYAGAVMTSSEREQFERLAMVSEFRSLCLKQRLDETLAAFGRARIEVMLLKGAALAHVAYTSFVERPMGDLDLLIDESRAAEAHELARELGWAWDQTRYPASRYVGHHHLPPLEDANRTGARLEVHTAVFMDGHTFALTRDELLRSARKLDWPGCDVLVPSSAHALLHLAVHFAWSHMMGFGAWRTFRDLDALMRAGLVDWPELATVARAHHAESSCYWMFRLARSLAGIAVPEGVIAELRPPQSDGVLRTLERHLSHDILPSDTLCPAESVRRLMWSLAILPWRHGHGRARPWDRDGEVAALRRPRGRGSRLSNQMTQLGMWRQYVRAMVSRG